MRIAVTIIINPIIGVALSQELEYQLGLSDPKDYTFDKVTAQVIEKRKKKLVKKFNLACFLRSDDLVL